ncbi:tetratricopeptide repeat protein [Sapientia aquatica]|uniref:Tetratricopeptide repeat protein n=1 Tax=Sapientia aquatica TaxID=1549640 RepID=A0A4R5VWF8_9BURK|nr:hypothetical protein [Sapientia aquatica]TDK63594.1 hypothetical protein E2I14_15445 [Sapientia aquatica]
MAKFVNNRSKIAALTLALLSACTFYSGAALAQSGSSTGNTKAADVAPPTLNPEIAKAVKAAQDFAAAKDYPSALAKLAETDSIANKTPYEIFAVERTRGDYLLAKGDKDNAAKAFVAVVETKYLKLADQLNLMQIIGQLYFQSGNYPSSISWLTRYHTEGGTDSRSYPLLTQAYYLNKEYALAYKGISAQVQAEIAAGKVPSEQSLKLVYSCISQMNDKEGTLKAVEQLNSYYPTAKNWTYLINQTQTKPGFSDRLYLDLYRLKQELGLLTVAAEIVDMSETATRAGLPAEAKKALDQGFAAGILGKGADAKKHADLLAAATRRAADDLKTMPQGEAGAAKSKDGTGLVNLGMAYATSGQYDKGISLIEQGITKGGLARLEEAKLHLGLVYFWAGQKDQAIKQLQTVQGADGIGDLARYWVMEINHPLLSK